MCIYQDVRKSGAFHMPIKKIGVSYILFNLPLATVKQINCISLGWFSFCGGGGGGGGVEGGGWMRGNLGIILVWVCEPVF